MPTLCVAGCSFSDRTQVSHCYGDFLSDMLHMDYLHLAGGCGSNARSIRLITESILNGTLAPGSTVIWQPTEVTRRELPSTWLTSTLAGHKFLESSSADWAQVKETHDQHAGKIRTRIQDLNLHYDNVVDDLYVTRFKMGSHAWQQGKIDTLWHTYTEQHGVIEKLDQYNFMLDLYRINQLLIHNNIKLILFWTYDDFKQDVLGKYVDTVDEWNINSFSLNHVWEIYRDPTRWYTLSNNYALNPAEKDWSHFSAEGHLQIAELLEKHINEAT